MKNATVTLFVDPAEILPSDPVARAEMLASGAHALELNSDGLVAVAVEAGLVDWARAGASINADGSVTLSEVLETLLTARAVECLRDGEAVDGLRLVLDDARAVERYLRLRDARRAREASISPER